MGRKKIHASDKAKRAKYATSKKGRLAVKKAQLKYRKSLVVRSNLLAEVYQWFMSKKIDNDLVTKISKVLAPAKKDKK